MKYKKLKAPFGWIGDKSQLVKDIVTLNGGAKAKKINEVLIMNY